MFYAAFFGNVLRCVAAVQKYQPQGEGSFVMTAAYSNIAEQGLRKNPTGPAVGEVAGMPLSNKKTCRTGPAHPAPV